MRQTFPTLVVASRTGHRDISGKPYQLDYSLFVGRVSTKIGPAEIEYSGQHSGGLDAIRIRV
jgi:hypothetical protein